jgi:long-chain acyl-CoA synthetase
VKKQNQIWKDLCRYGVGLWGDVIVRNAAFYPDREAFICADHRVTFKQYNERVNRLINGLKDRGLKNGDTIGVLSWNCLEYAEVFGAAGKAGFLLAPINARASTKEIEYLINDSGARLIFVCKELANVIVSLKSKLPKVEHLISFEKTTGLEDYNLIQLQYPASEPDFQPIDDDNPLLLIYTSGTTGVPKGALYTQRLWREDTISHSIEMPIEPEDKGLLMMPYFHIAGAVWHSAFFYQGACNVITKDFNPRETLEIIQREKITNISLVPTHIAALLSLPDFSKYDTSSLKRVKYVGSPIPVELLKRAIQTWGPIFIQGYGQTESGPIVTFLKEKEHDVLYKPAAEQKRLLSCGRPALDVQVRIVDDKGVDVPIGEKGEIIVRSRHIMKEYWNKPEETSKTIVDGWLHTRDVGRYDEEGFIYIIDRKNDMIISGGENIYPREVEDVLCQHPAVLECAVIGVPDPKWVEAIHAVVVLKRDSTISPDDLIDFCKKNVARYKAPKSIEIVLELPKSATGKILKKELRSKWLSTQIPIDQ